MRFAGDCFRAHDPRWSFSPLSGEGAAIHGGRFNPQGMPALYLSLSLETAIAEASQGFAGKLEPLLICQYAVDCDDIVDASDADIRSRYAIGDADLDCPWALDRAERRIPASWRLATRLHAVGQAGMIAPSFARHAPRDARNLVLWRWGPDLPYRVLCHDPSERLPKNQLSWT